MSSIRFGLGVRVYCEDDPRHVGTVEAVLWTSLYKIRWEETGWISFVEIGELRRCAEQPYRELFK